MPLPRASVRAGTVRRWRAGRGGSAQRGHPSQPAHIAAPGPPEAPSPRPPAQPRTADVRHESRDRVRVDRRPGPAWAPAVRSACHVRSVRVTPFPGRHELMTRALRSSETAVSTTWSSSTWNSSKGWPAGTPAAAAKRASSPVTSAAGDRGVGGEVGGFVAAAVQRHARVPTQVGERDRPRHAGRPEVPVGEARLDAADPRRPVGAAGWPAPCGRGRRTRHGPGRRARVRRPRARRRKPWRETAPSHRQNAAGVHTRGHPPVVPAAVW
ncbi:MAG: hypothetical protein JWP46_3307 [Modestobacter sp.]|nr:hypothetical protein [Modestobacter sp.]